MVWGPNLGINYPFRSGLKNYPTLETDPINFRALDSNGDGVIDYLDDPYGPYYPGDEYVDWVAMSLYWYPDEGTGFNGPVPPTYFKDQLLGYGPTVEQYSPLALQDGGLRQFYRRFVQEKNKPMMIPETGAPWFQNINNPAATELQIKQNWWNQIYNSVNDFPHLRMVVHFEENKQDAIGAARDWRILENPQILQAYKNDIGKWKNNLLFGTELFYNCDGTVTTKQIAA